MKNTHTIKLIDGRYRVISGNDYTYKQAQDVAQNENAKLVSNQQAVAEQKRTDTWFAIHGVPSEKSLKNLDAKLAAIRQAEKIENGSEEL